MILTTARNAFMTTPLASYVGILTLDAIKQKNSKKYAKARDSIRTELINSFKVLEYTEGLWAVERAMRLSLENKKKTLRIKNKKTGNTSTANDEEGNDIEITVDKSKITSSSNCDDKDDDLGTTDDEVIYKENGEDDNEDLDNEHEKNH